MYFKVKITKGLPQAKSGGFTGNNLNKQVISFGGADMNASSKHLENTRYLKQVPRDEANLEAEKGESAFGDINGDGFPEHMLIGGKRHTNGGTPLNLPDGTFIFSDTASMKITDCKILKMFGKACGKKGYTPAELAKPYDLNKYRKILEDPNSDKIDKKSAELMIKNINMKLGALALAQEAKKGFPQGIPEVARPYMEAMGIKEEDLIPQKAQPEAQVNNQAMQNPYENQGMGAQSPEEESVEQVQGMQNPQEESMESPMGRYGFQMGRRLRVAQQGMEQGQPSPEEMAMMQQQQEGAPQQQGGADPLAQMVQQVQQMLQQGAQPEDVIMQLLQNQVPPQAIMQILVQVGMPQEEAQAAIQEVMQQGQNPQEEMMETPMAQYGTTMGGFNPMEQFGSENNSENNQSTSGHGFFSNLFGGNNKRRIKNKKNVINNNYYGYPQSGAASNQNNDNTQARPQSQNNYYNTYGSATPTTPEVPSTPEVPTNQGENNFVNASLKNNQSAPFTPSFKGETPRFSQGNFSSTGYTPPPGYRSGGSLTRYQSKGEVKYNIPEGAIVINRGEYKTDEEYAKARDLEFAKAGNKPVYILMPDGKYKKVSQRTVGLDPYTGQDLGSTWNNAKEYAVTFREMEKSINTPEFTKVLADYTRTALKNKDKYKTSAGNTSKAYATYKDKVFRDEEIKNAFIQHQKRNTALQAHGIQARYFENAQTGRLLTPEQMVAKKIITDAGKPITLTEAQNQYKIYKDKDITDLGKAFDLVGIKLGDTALEQATFQGFTDAINNKVKTPEEKKALKDWGSYESGAADEKGQKNPRISPIDWVYADTTGEQKGTYTPTKNELYETDVEGTPIEEEIVQDEYQQEPNVEIPPTPWAQDKLNRLNAGLDYFSAKKYLPWAPYYHPETMTAHFVDPTRNLAANAELASITNQGLGQFMGAQDYSSRASSVSGQFAKNAADTLAQFNNQNVGIANQFEGNNTQIRNEAQRYNQGLSKQLYDQNVIANQQFDNTKRALRHNLVDSENTLLTNMWQTDAMNQMYPNYAVDPRAGGRMYYRNANRGFSPEQQKDYFAYANKINAAGLPEKSQGLLLNNYMNQRGISNEIPDMYNNMSQVKKGGAVQMAYVMGSNVFPFMFT